jgi:hypothetical protein
MIQYDKDGATLFYIDAKGTKISAGVFDGKKYNDMDAIMLEQIAALTENNHAVESYNLSLQSAQTSVSAGRAADAPPKPLQHMVSDTGESTYVPFSPPFADLVPLKITASSSGAIAVPTVDTQAVMYAMITAIYRKMFPTP